MAKLTLGAFIGSFVQRTVSEHRTPEAAPGIAFRPDKKPDKPEKEDEFKKGAAA